MKAKYNTHEFSSAELLTETDGAAKHGGKVKDAGPLASAHPGAIVPPMKQASLALADSMRSRPRGPRMLGLKS